MLVLSLLATVLPLASAAVPRVRPSPSTGGGCVFNPASTAVPARCSAGDAPYSIAERELFSKLFCVGGVDNVKRPYLLVPGTGNTGAESFSPGLLTTLGKGAGLGYDVCWVSPPPSMMNDIQDNAEYIVYAMALLHSKAGPLPISGWSQGNLATQWALTFYPSMRAKTRTFISLAGDFRGSNLLNGGFVASLLPFAKRQQSLSGSSASVMQQSSTSKFLANLSLKGGLGAWVPTTSIYSQTDQIIQPENNTPLATSFLRNASNIYIQTYCPLLPFLHEDHLYANLSFQILKFALASPNLVASPREVATLFRSGAIKCDLLPAPGLGPLNAASVKGSLLIGLSNFANVNFWVDAEPAARAYVAATPNNPTH